MLITFTAYILIPVYTLLFVAGSDWFTTNFSVLGNIAGRNEAFVLWGLMVGIYFFVCLRKIFRRMPEKPAGTWLVPLALVLLDFAVTTPYLPEMFPLKAYLHIVFAFLAAACLILCVFLTVLKLYQRDPREMCIRDSRQTDPAAQLLNIQADIGSVLRIQVTDAAAAVEAQMEPYLRVGRIVVEALVLVQVLASQLPQPLPADIPVSYTHLGSARCRRTITFCCTSWPRHMWETGPGS